MRALLISTLAVALSLFPGRSDAGDPALDRALIDAIKSSHPERVAVLLSQGASPDAENGLPLRFAVATNNLPLIRLLLRSHANPSAEGAFGQTALKVAALGGDPVIGKLLLDAGADVQYSWKGDPATALHIAAFCGSGDCDRFVKLLLDAGADPNARDRHSMTPLLIAVQRGESALSPFLALLPVSNVHLASSDGSTALHIAVERQWATAVHALLVAGADASAADAYGRTPLHLVVSQGTGKDRGLITRMLLEGGAGVDLRSRGGATPLYLAACQGEGELARELLDACATPDLAEDEGVTPLMCAAASHGSTQVEVVTLLLERGANPNLLNKSGRSALLFALEAHNLFRVRILLAHGADPTCAMARVDPRATTPGPLRTSSRSGFCGNAGWSEVKTGGSSSSSPRRRTATSRSSARAWRPGPGRTFRRRTATPLSLRP
jgi:ankyrin repeat protein